MKAWKSGIDELRSALSMGAIQPVITPNPLQAMALSVMARS
jgi:hypothetical protein